MTLASGDIPDLMFVLDPFDPLVMQMAKEGAFWELTPELVKGYPNLAAYPSAVWENSKMQDGKTTVFLRFAQWAGGLYQYSQRLVG